MGVTSGCGCKEVYRFPHITYPYSSCICSFLQQHPYFLFIFKMFFSLYIYSSDYDKVILFLMHHVLYDSIMAVRLIHISSWDRSRALIWNSFFRQEKPLSSIIPRDPTSSVITCPL